MTDQTAHATVAPAVTEAVNRQILLVVTGLTPQVVTETLYALWRQDPALWPDAVHLITTLRGAEHARLNLLSPAIDWLGRLRREYALPPIAFPAENIHVITGPDGTRLDDIRTPDENVCAADFITDLVRHLTADPDTALHVSLAGGRKTMGYFVGYALSLFGRPQDCLSHVLVSEYFNAKNSKLNRTLKDKLGALAARPYLVLQEPDGAGYALALPAAAIRYADVQAPGQDAVAQTGAIRLSEIQE